MTTTTVTIFFDGERYHGVASDGRKFDGIKRSQLVRNVQARYGAAVTIVDRDRA